MEILIPEIVMLPLQRYMTHLLIIKTATGPDFYSTCSWTVSNFTIIVIIRSTNGKICPFKYCETGNFRLHFNFAIFANFVNSRKLSAREKKKSMHTSI